MDKIVVYIIGLLMGIALAAIPGCMVWLVWNFTIIKIFPVVEISFIDGLGLVVLVQALKGNSNES